MVKLKFFLSVVLIHSAGFYGFCEDIIQNGHFEQGLTGWTVSWKAEPLFKANSSPECSLVYSRTGNQLPEANAFVKQTITLQPDRYYDLTVDYRADSALTPFIWITAGDDKNSKPIRLIRLPNNSTRSVFKSLLNIGKNKGPFSFQFYPGIDPKGPMMNHSRPKSSATGTAELFSITLTPSSFRDPEPVRLDEKMRTETVTYKTVDGIDLILKLDFPLNPPKEKMPMVFWVHGGGWVTGSPDTMLWRSSQLAPLGIANARVQYRLIKNGGTFPKSFGDLLDAIQWLRDHANEYNIDISRMVISGGSAGGQLSSTLAQKTPECIGYMGMCGLYDVVNLGTSRFGRSEKFLLNNDPALLKKASAIYNIRENPPKALLIHGKSDATIDYMQAVRFAEELRRHGGSVQTLILEGTGHDFGYPDAVDKAINGFLHSLGFPVAP